MKLNVKKLFKRKNFGLVIFILIIGLSQVMAQDEKPQYKSFVPTPTLSEISYGNHEMQTMDFWKAKSDSPTPLVFVIHGGGFREGEKEWVHRFVDVKQLLDAKISVVSINYRLMKHIKVTNSIPAVKVSIYDAARALQFVRSKAKEWNIDKKRIGGAGGSAGGTACLWLAYHDDLANPKSNDPVARESTRLYCSAIICPQTSIDPKQMKEWVPNNTYGAHLFNRNSFEQFLAARDTIMPWINEYSPYALLSLDDPQTYMYFRTPPDVGQEQKDPPHSSNFGVKLEEHCKEYGVKCEIQYPGATGTIHENTTEYLISTLNGF